MADKFIQMAIGVGFTVLFFFVSFIMLHLGHLWASGMCLALSSCSLAGFIMAMADES